MRRSVLVMLASKHDGVTVQPAQFWWRDQIPPRLFRASRMRSCVLVARSDAGGTFPRQQNPELRLVARSNVAGLSRQRGHSSGGAIRRRRGFLAPAEPGALLWWRN